MRGLERKKCGFGGPIFQNFPVKFPVSREFGQRKVSARLSAPPHSLECREIRWAFPDNHAKSPPIFDFPSSNRTGDNGLRHPTSAGILHFLWQANWQSGFGTATQSALQRNLPALLLKSREIASLLFRRLRLRRAWIA